MQSEQVRQFSETGVTTLPSMLELRLGPGYPRSHTSSVQAQDSAIYALIPKFVMARRRPRPLALLMSPLNPDQPPTLNPKLVSAETLN